MSYLKKIFPDLADRIISMPAVYYDWGDVFDLEVFECHTDADKRFTELVSQAISEAGEKLNDGDYDFSATICLVDDLDLLPSELVPLTLEFEETGASLPGSTTDVSADFRDVRESLDRFIAVDIVDHGDDCFVSITTES